jgi:hypothetical protein
VVAALAAVVAAASTVAAVVAVASTAAAVVAAATAAAVVVVTTAVAVATAGATTTGTNPTAACRNDRPSQIPHRVSGSLPSGNGPLTFYCLFRRKPRNLGREMTCRFWMDDQECILFVILCPLSVAFLRNQ